MNDFKRILVVSRSTIHCKKALQYGIALAKLFNSKLFVLHVIHDPFNIEGWNLPVPSLKKEYENLVIKEREEIDSIIKSEQANGLDITEWIRNGKPIDEVFAVIKEEKIDLVIIAGHEEGRFEHFLFGRAVEGLIRKLPCTILLVKCNPGHQFDR